MNILVERMSKRKHASDTEGFMHQYYSGLRNRKVTKSFTWKREPGSVDHTIRTVAQDPTAGSVVKDPPARHSYMLRSQGTPQRDSGPLVKDPPARHSYMLRSQGTPQHDSGPQDPPARHSYMLRSRGTPQLDSGPLVYPPYKYGASDVTSYGYGTHFYTSHGSGAAYHRSYGSRDQYPHSYGSRDHYYHSYGSRNHYPDSYGFRGYYPHSLGSELQYPLGVGNSDPLPYAVVGDGHLPYSHDIAAHDLPSHDFHSYEDGAKALSPKFPAVSVCGLPSNCSEVDIVQFFDGLHIVDVILIFIGKTFSGKAVVVFSNATLADSALHRNNRKLGDASVEIDTCRRQEYYDAVAAVVNGGVDFQNTRAQAMKHTCDPNGNAVADSNFFASPQGQVTRRNDINAVNHFHEQRSDAVADSKLYECPKAENPINNDYAKHTDCHGRIKLTGPGSLSQGRPMGSSDKDQQVCTQILKLCNVPPSADKYEIIEFFNEFNLALDRLQVVCRQNGIATGEVYVEFDSVEDAKKAISKDKKMILTHCVELFPSSPNEASRAMSGSGK